MVPKKRQSKRMSCAKRYKIEKKIREAERKRRREARRNGVVKKSKKDPGIPNLWPYKEKLLNQIEESKRMAEEEKRRKRQMEIQKKKKKKEANSLQALARSAEQRARAFDAQQANTEMTWEGSRDVEESAITTKDNSRRAYYREFRKVVEAADVILEVLDARDPLGCRAKHVERFILDQGLRKRIILVLNKIDLVPRHAVEQWLKYLRNEFPTVAFKASTQSQRQHLGQSNVSAMMASEETLSRSESLGAENLIQLLKNYSRNSGLKTSITVGVIGFPNVGKSSVINSLRRARVCTVGAAPGVTKSLQEIQLDKHIKLIDCPGIVFSKNPSKDSMEMLLRNCVKLELLDDPIAPVEAVIARCQPQQLMMLYNLPAFKTPHEFLILLAQQRGKLKKGGVTDLEGTARSVLKDWNSGKIPFYTLPPAVQHVQRSELVTSWGKEFDLNALLNESDQSTLSAAKATNTGIAVMASEMNDDDEDDGWLQEAMSTDGEDDDEEDEEEEDDDDEMEMMEDTDEESQQPAMMIRDDVLTKRSAKSTKVSSNQRVLSEAEAAINPQTNKMLKKQLKKQRKQAMRKGTVPMPSMEDEDEEVVSDEDYDFGEYFQEEQSSEEEELVSDDDL